MLPGCSIEAVGSSGPLGTTHRSAEAPREWSLWPGRLVVPPYWELFGDQLNSHPVGFHMCQLPAQEVASWFMRGAASKEHFERKFDGHSYHKVKISFALDSS